VRLQTPGDIRDRAVRRLRAPGVAIPDYLLAHVAPLERQAYSDPGQQDGDI